MKKIIKVINDQGKILLFHDKFMTLEFFNNDFIFNTNNNITEDLIFDENDKLIKPDVKTTTTPRLSLGMDENSGEIILKRGGYVRRYYDLNIYFLFCNLININNPYITTNVIKKKRENKKKISYNKFKKGLKNQLRRELADDLKDDLKYLLKDDLKIELGEVLKNEIKIELKKELKENVEGKIAEVLNVLDNLSSKVVKIPNTFL